MILLLAGTGDGREIFSVLSKKGYPVLAAVATSYGARILSGECLSGGAQLSSQPLDSSAIVSLIQEKGIRAVVDATHPFAVQASANAIRACEITGVRYIRYERPSSDLPDNPLIFHCRDFYEAAWKAVSLGETIFLTTGSKTLPVFVEAAQRSGKRVVARVLPDPDVLAGCLALGLQPADLIAMQGPFSYELNAALLRQYWASVLVTKESGPAGGTDHKVKAAVDLGLPVVLIERSVKKYPLVVSTCGELLQVLESFFIEEDSQMKTGLVVLGHGSRVAVDEANQVLLSLAAMVKERTSFDLLETAFMNPKSQRQNLAEAVGKMVRGGAKRIIVAPVFLSNGLHMQKDIPAEIVELKEKYQVEISLAAHLGPDPRIAEVVVERIREAEQNSESHLGE